MLVDRVRKLYPIYISRPSSVNKQSHFAGGVLTPALDQMGCSPPLETPQFCSRIKWRDLHRSNTTSAVRHLRFSYPRC